EHADGHLSVRRKTKVFLYAAVPGELVQRKVAEPKADLSGFGEKLDTFAGLPECVGRAIAIDAKSELAGDEQAKSDFRGIENARKVEVDNDFADEADARKQRDEGKRLNAFLLNHRQKTLGKVGKFHVADTNGSGI